MRPGLHLSNCSPITVADEDIVRRWAPLSALLAMNNIVEDEAEIGKLISLWELAGRPLLVLRKYFEPEHGLHPNRWGIHAMESVIMARRCMARGVPARKIALKPFNEPNMPTWACNEPYGEGFGDQPEHIERYGQALATFIDVAKNEEPGVLIGGPHLTVGNHDVRFPNDAEGRYYYGPNSLCQHALDRLDLHFVHCYGFRRGQYKDPAHGLRFLEYEKYFSGKDIYIVEGTYGIKWENGNSIDPAQNNVRGEDTVAYLRLLDQYPQVKGITLWIGGWTGWQEHRHSDGADPGSHRPVVRYVEEYVKGIGPGPDPGPLPQPDPEPEPGPSPEPPLSPHGEIEFVGLSEEMITALSISGPEDPTKPYWAVRRVEVQPETDKMDGFAVILDAGRQTARFFWPGGAVEALSKADQYAPLGARENAASMPMFEPWGSYGVRILEGQSEALRGFGLYGDLPNLDPTHTAHHPVLVYFELVEPEPGPAPEPEPEPPPGPEPGPEPEPGPDVPYKLVTALNRRLKAAGLALLVDMRGQIEAIADLDAVGKRDLGPEDLMNITLHHDAITGPLNVLAIAKYHIETRKWPHIAYHFLIDQVGTVWFCKKLRHYSAQAGNERINRYGISVTVHGDFTKESPTEAQLKGLKCLVDSLEEFVGGSWGQCYPLPIIRHKDIVETECPGDLYEKYREHLAAGRSL